MFFFRPSRRAAPAALIAGSVSLAALLSACAPDLGPAPTVKPLAEYQTQRALGQSVDVAWPGQDWWKRFNDPQLNTLIEEALAGSPDLKIAQARLNEAVSRAEQAGAALGPSLNASGNIQETAVTLNVKGLPSQAKDFLPKTAQPFTQLGAKAAYEFDFFGKNHAAVAAASSERKAAEFELQAARMEISTAVAMAYVDLMRLTADRQAALDAVKVRSDTLKLVSDRLQNGLENQGEVAQSSALRNVSLGDVAALDLQIDMTRHQLAALVGKGPDRGIDITAYQGPVSFPFDLPSNLPADLIGRRPDVAAARLRVEAAASQIKVARAAFYPNVSLNGSILDLSFTPDQLFTHNVVLAQVGPAVSLPIFQGGRLKGAYRGARAEYELAVANYDKAIAAALKDVADAVTSQKAAITQGQYAQKAVDDSKKAYDLALMRYKGGLSPYLVVLTAQSTLIQQQRSLADLELLSLSGNVALVRALGGGFIDDSSSSSSNSKGPSHG